MAYIVSPWLVYLIGILDSLKEASSVAAVVLGVVVPLIAVMKCIEDIEEIKVWHIVSGTVLFFIALIFTIAIPSRETVIQMVLAKNLTYTNAGIIVTEGRNIKDQLKQDVIDIILAVEEKKPSK